jgi:hypothetical protein
MAEFIPDRLPSKASRGEERTFALLKKLPDDYLVYYEPNIENRHPDFIVIAPDLGVIVIEVKGWYLDDILRASDTEVITNFDNRERKEVHPLAQARAYQWRLARVCEKNPKRSLLLYQSGQYKDKFIFPFCHFVVLSNISRENIDRKKEHDMYTIFRPENTLYRDELVALEDASPAELRKTLIRFFNPFWKITPFTPNQVTVIRSIIHPEIILSYIPTRPLTEKETDQCFDLVVLDRRQENNARKIGEGHRIIYGVAGSGKTVLLISRSKWLNDRDPDAKILLLCYNVVLSAHLKQLLKDYSRIHVHHFDGWSISNGVTRRRKDPSTGKIETDESLGKRLLEHLKERTGDYRNYDAILIDEAQDFPACWFICILEALRDPLDGDLLIVCDGNQGVRLIGSVSWKSIGIKAAGRTIHQAFDLDRNYRNTKEILKLAQHFTAKNIKNSEDSISIVPVDPSQASRRGPRPILYSCKDHADECQRIIHIVRRLLDGKVKFLNKSVKLRPQEIGILYHGIPKKERDLFEGFIEDLNKIAPVTWLNENRWTRTKVFEQSIKVQTVYSAKGLQYHVVFVMWADQFKPRKNEDRDHEERLLYVALTRASDILIVTYSELNDFIDKMVKSGETEQN